MKHQLRFFFKPSGTTRCLACWHWVKSGGMQLTAKRRLANFIESLINFPLQGIVFHRISRCQTDSHPSAMSKRRLSKILYLRFESWNSKIRASRGAEAVKQRNERVGEFDKKRKSRQTFTSMKLGCMIRILAGFQRKRSSGLYELTIRVPPLLGPQ